MKESGFPLTTVGQSHSYNFDRVKGNLNHRKTSASSFTEYFQYDHLNRLTKFGNNTMAYNERGNITQKTGVGPYYYSSAKPYAVTRTGYLSLPGIEKEQVYQNISYTSFQRPAIIEEAGYTTTFTYNASGDRIKSVTVDSDNKEVETKTYFGGNYEETKDETRLYLGGDYYSAPAVRIKKAGQWKLYYILRDYLGSITNITDENGTVVETNYFDPWGNQVDPSTGEIYARGEEPALMLERGFTGHEHLARYGLINMNARLYDPVLGRFLSPDPYVQAPDFSQNFNRYSYCVNNPFKYTDPSGEWFLIDDLIAGAIGGIVNVVSNIGNIKNIGHAFSLFGVGAAAGVTTIYAGPTVGGGVLGVGNSIINQGFTNGWNNISFGQVAMDGLMGGMMAFAGSKVSGFISPHVGQLTSGLGGPAVQQMALQGVTGYATGFTLTTGVALLNGESLEDALSQGNQGGLMGLATGTISGLATGIRQAHQQKLNPWTGKSITSTNVESLINEATGVTTLTDGKIQGFVEGDAQTIFQNLTKESLHIRDNLYKLPDGTYINYHPSTSTKIPTIDINKGGIIYKIRIKM